MKTERIRGDAERRGAGARRADVGNGVRVGAKRHEPFRAIGSAERQVLADVVPEALIVLSCTPCAGGSVPPYTIYPLGAARRSGSNCR